MTQGMPTTTETIRPRTMAWTPATAAPSGSFSPMRRATMAVVDRLSPMATAKTRLSMRFGEADGGDGVCAEAADPEDVDDGEERFEHHLEHHGDREEQDGAVEVAGGVVLMRAANGLADGGPQARLWDVGDGGRHVHKTPSNFSRAGLAGDAARAAFTAE